MKTAITTPTGKIGRQVVNKLLDKGGHELVLLARNPDSLQSEQSRGAVVIAGDLGDIDFVKRATQGVDALFWVIPPRFDTEDVVAYYGESARIAAAAVQANHIGKVVFISSIGGHLGKGVGPVSGFLDAERSLRETGANVVILRPTFFMENLLVSAEHIRSAKSIFLPVSGTTGIPMIATRDIAEVAVAYLTGSSSGIRVVPLHGPRDYTFNEIADIIGRALGQKIRYVMVSSDQTRDALRSMGASHHMADMMVELYEAIDQGRLQAEYPRSAESTTPTRFEEVAERVIVPAVKGRK